jgi:hypothetical protein
MVSVGSLSTRLGLIVEKFLSRCWQGSAFERYLGILRCAPLAYFLEHQNKIEAGKIRGEEEELADTFRGV